MLLLLGPLSPGLGPLGPWLELGGKAGPAQSPLPMLDGARKDHMIKKAHTHTQRRGGQWAKLSHLQGTGKGAREGDGESKDETATTKVD